jgi:excisionase family DNA binding protein
MKTTITTDQSTLTTSKVAYRVNEVVACCGLGRSTIYDEIKAGRLKAIKVAGRRLILRDDLEAFLRSTT